MTTLPIFISSDVVSAVNVNDVVRAGQSIARKASRKDFVINLVEQFASPANKVRKMLRKKPGDFVEVGDVLAVKKNFFGLSEEKLISRVAGAFTRYERDTGNVFIELPFSETAGEVLSPVDGIVKVCDNEKIVIGIEKGFLTGRKGTGGSVMGDAYILHEAFSEEYSKKSSDISLYYSLDSRAVGKIVVGKSFSRDILIKCIGLGAIGVVGTGIRDDDINYLESRKMNVPLLEVDEDILSEVVKWKKKRFYLNSPEKVIVFLHA